MAEYPTGMKVISELCRVCGSYKVTLLDYDEGGLGYLPCRHERIEALRLWAIRRLGA